MADAGLAVLAYRANRSNPALPIELAFSRRGRPVDDVAADKLKKQPADGQGKLDGPD